MSEPNNNPNQQKQNQQNDGNQQNNPPEIDYDRLAEIISGKQNVAEETILKKYFQEQGLSGDEMKQAIAAYKEKKAANTPDVNKLQSDLSAAQSDGLKARIDLAATKAAIKQGVPVESVEYLLRMADFSKATDESGKVSDEAIEEAIKKVLEDVPALKGTTKSGGKKGFEKIGGDGEGDGDDGITDDALRRAFGLKPKK